MISYDVSWPSMIHHASFQLGNVYNMILVTLKITSPVCNSIHVFFKIGTFEFKWAHPFLQWIRHDIFMYRYIVTCHLIGIKVLWWRETYTHFVKEFICIKLSHLVLCTFHHKFKYRCYKMCTPHYKIFLLIFFLSVK